MFAAIAEQSGILAISLMCDLMQGGFFAEYLQKRGSRLAFQKDPLERRLHCTDVPGEDCCGMIRHSFDLITTTGG